MMLTSDQNISDLDYTVLYRIKDAGQFLFNLRDPEETVKVISELAEILTPHRSGKKQRALSARWATAVAQLPRRGS